MGYWRSILVVSSLALAAGVGCIADTVGPRTTGTSTGRQGPIYGKVLSDAGTPKAGVRVVAYASDAAPAEVATGSAQAYRIASAGDAVTDAKGAFVIEVRSAGNYNLEAVESDKSKAWQSSVAFKAGQKVGVGQMRLAPTGRITGLVRASDPVVKDLSNTFVYIPGSSYVAVTGPDGAYTLSNVPVGKFDLVAYNVDLGDARIPDGTTVKNPVAVRAEETTEAPPMTLAIQPPQLLAVKRSGQDVVTDNAAPGASVDMHGRYFGARRGTRFEVRFNGSPAESNRKSDELVTVKVPSGATNGDLVVTVGPLSSNRLAFRIIDKVALQCPQPDFLVRGGTLDVSSLLSVLDTRGNPIVGAMQGTTVAKPFPYVTWKSDSDRVLVDDKGVLSGLAKGPVVVKAMAGAIESAGCAVTVLDPTDPTPTPRPGGSGSPAPTASPGGGPTASPTASPTAGPSATPTAGPTASPNASPTAAPTATPTPTPPPTPTPTPTPASTATPVVITLSLNPSSLSLDVPPTGATPAPGFTVSATVTATVQGGSQGVTWTVSDATRLKITPQTSTTALVETLATAASGTASVTATSVDDPGKSKSLTVTVTRQSGLDVEID